MKLSRKIASFVFAWALAHPAVAAAVGIDGVWQNRNHTVDVRIAPCGARYCGIVIAARGEALDKARALGMTRLVGAHILKDYVPSRDGTWRGSVFVPELRGHVGSTIRLVDDHTLQVSGCALGGLVCKTKVWHRVSTH